MVDAYTTDEEKVEAIKKWFKENGASLVTGILLGLAVLFGTKAWFGYKEQQASAASAVYLQFMEAVGRGQAEAVVRHSQTLIGEYRSTPYATLATMAMARQKVEEGELEAARAHLEWAVRHAKSEHLQVLARVRLIRVLLALEALDAAQELLDKRGRAPTFATLYDELQGDLYVLRGEPRKAYEAYERALAELPEDAPNRLLLETKRDEARLPAAEATS